MPLKDFFLGFGYFRKGWRLFKTVPGIKVWIIIPFIIDLLLVSFLFSWGLPKTSIWSEKALTMMFDNASWFYRILYYPLKLITSLGFIVFVLLGLYLIATIIAGPFYSIVVEKVHMHLGYKKTRPLKTKEWIKLNIRMLVISLLRAALFGLFAVVLFALSFVPVVSLVAAFCAFLIMAFDVVDYSFEIAEMGLSERMDYFRNNIAAFSGMAAFIGMTMFVPGLILLIMPINVLGATQVHLDLEAKDDSRPYSPANMQKT